MRRTVASPSVAVPRYGARTGPPPNQDVRARSRSAIHASRIAVSPVARTIQSVTGEVRLSTNRASSRSMIENVAPDQPSVGNGCSGRMWRSKRRSSSGSVSRGGAAIRWGAGAVGPAVEVHDVGVGAVAREHDHQRLRGGGVRLHVDLAGRDVDEVAGSGLQRCSVPPPHV